MTETDDIDRLAAGPPGVPPSGSGGQTVAEPKRSKMEKEYTQPIGLDVGTSRIVVARSNDKRYDYDVELNAFLTLPYSRLAESLLQRENVFHEVKGSEIVVAGNDAQRFAEVFHIETRRPMQSGVLNPQEPHSLAVVSRIISKVAGKAQVEGQKVFFSVPAPGAEGEGGIAFHEASIRQVLSELGYEATPIEEGLAVVFGELGGSNYTGIGISCGSGLCNVCLSVLSVPVISFSVPKAGDFIDAQAALVTGDVATRMRVHKEESFHLNGLGSDRVQNALTVYYQEMIEELVEALHDHISAARRLPKLDQAIPLVVCGGTAAPKGFLEQFGRALRALDFPVRLSELRVSADPLNSTARGCLMAALC
ncbi:MAG TPA: hypothetical protein VLY24_04855 [Bryobacteraceae bacterium]|nr:hypothetical protein [Bryobacteraceae bacterium]